VFLTSAARWAEKWLVDPALRFALPTDCFCCGEPLGRRQHLGACLACWSRLAPLRPPLCPKCGVSRPKVTDLLGPAAGTCARCQLAPPAADSVRAAVVYDATARRFIHRIKFGRRRELLPALARQLACAIRAAGLERSCALVTPIPSNPLADLRRGFSTSRELSRLLSLELRAKYAGYLLSRRLLGGGAQKRLGASGRRRRAGTLFDLRGRLRGEIVLLVDDIMTTGSSIEACAGLLKTAGATEVRVGVWARTLEERETPITTA
jgi:ComF family protein